MPSENSPLLSGGVNGHSQPISYVHRVLGSFKPSQGEPGWLPSFRAFFLGSWFNVLLLFVPLSAVSHYSNWDAGLRFLFSFMAIMPLAKLLGVATDQMSFKLGQTMAGLLNASFGNAVEIIVGVAALLQGELRIVQTSMLGSILSNIVLVLGCSFLAGGIYYKESDFSSTAAQLSASLLTLSCITLVIPAAYRSTQIASPTTPDGPVDDMEKGLLTISHGTAIILILVYIGYLVFQLKTHANVFVDAKSNSNANNDFVANEAEEATDEEEEVPFMNVWAAATALCLVTVVTSFCADYLVGSIEETANRYHISKAFIGIILIPIVANAAEHVTSVWMAMKNKTELVIGICIGSSIQIATFVIPLLVIIGWITGHHLTLFFANFETIVLFVSVVLVNLLIMDGKSNYMEGVTLLALYIVIALSFWVS